MSCLRCQHVTPMLARSFRREVQAIQFPASSLAPMRQTGRCCCDVVFGKVCRSQRFLNPHLLQTVNQVMASTSAVSCCFHRADSCLGAVHSCGPTKACAIDELNTTV